MGLDQLDALPGLLEALGLEASMGFLFTDQKLEQGVYKPKRRHLDPCLEKNKIQKTWNEIKC